MIADPFLGRSLRLSVPVWSTEAPARGGAGSHLGKAARHRYCYVRIIRPNMNERPAATGSASDWLIDRMLRGLIATALSLPWHRRVAMVAWVTRRAIGPLAGYRRRALRHLSMIKPDWPLALRRRVAAEVLDNFGRTMIENYSGSEFAARIAKTPPTGPGLAAVATARAQGRPVIFVTGHFGNYEAPRHALQALGYDVSILYRPMSNAFFDAHYSGTLSSVSGPAFARSPRGTMGLVRLLKAGGMATILFDVHDGRGVPLNFLGRPAMTATSVADLALKYDAVVIPYFGIRRPDRTSFDIVIEAPVPHDSPVAMMRAITDRLEAQIAAYPGQWLWVHKRWKTARAALA